MTTKHTPGPWRLCHHLQSAEKDAACQCGYRGVIWGPEHERPMAICQPGHDAEVQGEEGLGPQRYERSIELANARLIAAAPELLHALEALLDMDISYQRGPKVQEAESAARLAVAKARGTA